VLYPSGRFAACLSGLAFLDGSNSASSFTRCELTYPGLASLYVGAIPRFIVTRVAVFYR
jgi:hypothetical protein